MTTSERAHARELAHLAALETKIPRLRAFTSEVYSAWEAEPEGIRKNDLDAVLTLLDIRQERLHELSDHDEQEFRNFLGLWTEVIG